MNHIFQMCDTSPDVRHQYVSRQFICVTWVRAMCHILMPHIWIQFICVTYEFNSYVSHMNSIHMCESVPIHMWVTGHQPPAPTMYDSIYICDMTHFLRVTWLISCMWHDSVHMCDMTQSSHIREWVLSHVWTESCHTYKLCHVICKKWVMSHIRIESCHIPSSTPPRRLESAGTARTDALRRCV